MNTQMFKKDFLTAITIETTMHRILNLFISGLCNMLAHIYIGHTSLYQLLFAKSMQGIYRNFCTLLNHIQ